MFNRAIVGRLLVGCTFTMILGVLAVQLQKNNVSPLIGQANNLPDDLPAFCQCGPDCVDCFNAVPPIAGGTYPTPSAEDRCNALCNPQECSDDPNSGSMHYPIACG